jgi:hypothetical protein
MRETMASTIHYLPKQAAVRVTKMQDRPEERRVVMSKSKFIFLLVLTALFFKTPAFAQENQGTPEQRAACLPDAFRLCSSYIPDPTLVESCLRQKNLNSALRADQCSGEALPREEDRVLTKE